MYELCFFVFSNTGFKFPCADTVLVKVVGIHLVDVESGIGIVFPTAAKVYNIIDTSDLVVAAECQSEGVVFTVRCVWNGNLTENRSIECAGSTETVDAQGVVAAVFRSPFLVVDHARGNHVHVNVCEHVGSYNHRAVLVIECLYHLGECVLIFVYVVRIKLNGELATVGVVDTEIPAATDAKVVAFGDDVDYTWV